MKERWLELFGPRTRSLLVMGTALGAALSAVEVGFAAVLQSFLVAIGALADTSTLWLKPEQAVLALVGVGLVRSLLVWAQIYVHGAAGEELKHQLRSRLVSRVLNSRSASSAHAMALFSQAAEAAGAFAGSGQMLCVQAASAFVLAFSLFWLSPKLFAFSALALVALAVPMRLVDRRIKLSGAGVAEEWQRASEHVLTGIRNLILLQIYGTQEKENEKAQTSMAAYRKHVLLYYFISGFKAAVPQAAGLLLVAVISWSYRRSLPLSPAGFVAFIYLFLRLVQTVAAAGQAMTSALMNWPATKRWLDGALESFEQAEPATPGPRPSEVGWKLRDVSFSYGDTSVLKGLDFDVKPRTATLIVGPSGAGKSTLLLLLLGNLAPTRGGVSLLLDGRDVSVAEGRGALLPAVGYVGPETFIIQGTVAENLAYGLDRTPSRDELLQALDRARLQADLERKLTEQGQGLSAGQKQRLALARALLRKPAVLVLDEATSNLDLDTEEKIIDTLSQLKGELTIIAVTHRPSLLRLADQTIRLGENHETVLSRRP